MMKYHLTLVRMALMKEKKKRKRGRKRRRRKEAETSSSCLSAAVPQQSTYYQTLPSPKNQQVPQGKVTYPSLLSKILDSLLFLPSAVP